ncbi:tyrosine-type recombinase/integrase [Thioalkalivibrio sp. ALE30]|uniref:tyrosine-type recombinase/integrase n=1 Tax=Thioalkalivibrio sp. ALE30 TaxID=1158181 RepID=UPI00037D291B|nr:tyrosine-type recombinase/integrase [Thioalkalivibrio sp. ALE30]
MLVHSLVQSGHPYVTPRGRVFWFRFAMPRHVRRLCPHLPREIKRTLRTDSYPEALYLVSQRGDVIRQVKRSRCKQTLERLCTRLADFSEAQEDLVGQSSGRAAEGVTVALKASGGGVQPETEKTIELTLSEAWKQFVSGKQWTDKLRKNNESLMANLKFFLGDVRVSEIGKKDLQVVLERIARLPQRNRKAYRGRSLKELVEAQIPPEHRISGKTVKEHLKLCQSFFGTYLTRELGVLKRSPTEGLKLTHPDARFAALGDADVRSLLEKAKGKPEWVRWFMLLAAYTGARRSELAGLIPSDFKRCSDTGRHYVVIRGGKTRAARRMIPLHLQLLGSGLLDWVARHDGLLFPTANANPNRVTDHFSSLCPARVNDLGERVVFHSLRHTFITKARAAGVSTARVQQVVGHETKGGGVTDRYTHVFHLRHVLEVVDSISYAECQ